MKKQGPYTITNHKEIYKNRWLEVYEDTVIRPDGGDGIWSISNVGPGTAILPIDSDNNIYLAHGYMYANDIETNVLPGGKIDNNESPLECAQRELEEELGLRSNEWISLGSYHAYPAIIKDCTYVFLALNVTQHDISDPDGENFTLEKIPLEKAVAMVQDGKIKHANAAHAIMHAYIHINNL